MKILSMLEQRVNALKEKLYKLNDEHNAAGDETTRGQLLNDMQLTMEQIINLRNVIADIKQMHR